MFSSFGQEDQDHPILAALDADALRHPAHRKKPSIRRELSALLTRIAKRIELRSAIPERYSLIAEWCHHVPLDAVLKLARTALRR